MGSCLLADLEGKAMAVAGALARHSNVEVDNTAGQGHDLVIPQVNGEKGALCGQTPGARQCLQCTTQQEGSIMAYVTCSMCALPVGCGVVQENIMHCFQKQLMVGRGQTPQQAIIGCVLCKPQATQVILTRS